jgi:hypothetical protein
LRLALRLCVCGHPASAHLDFAGACDAHECCQCMEFEPDESAEGMPESGYPERWR